MLTAIKLLHTTIWALLATSILALPILAVLRRFRWATILTVMVLLECGVLAANGGRCPLTDLAARYTLDRAANFDVYLPNWLARYNKAIFGTLFVFSELIVVWHWRGLAVKQTAKAGVLYFMLVFSAGFVLGTIRTLWVVPKLGVRTAELIEAPLMFGLSILAARWVVRRLRLPPDCLKRLAFGCVALGLMLLVEFTFVLWIRGITMREYFATRDPISGGVYLLTLGAFAVIPVFVERQRPTNTPSGMPTQG
ncbi:MAG: hypothetical protein ABSG70_14935 [Terriglobales bacterium]|jgi:hypothetical protein